MTFCPDCDSEFYYVDPSDRDQYIALFDYFSYLKTARIVELQKIAQDLGAKHFKVTYKEEESSSSEKKVKVQVKIAAAATADDGHVSSEKKILNSKNSGRNGLPRTFSNEAAFKIYAERPCYSKSYYNENG